MALSRRNRGSTLNIWPGFVDALTQLTMVIVFLLLIFTVGQFYLSGAVSSKDQAIKQLTQQIAELNQMLSLGKASEKDLQATIARLTEEAAQAKIERDAALADAQQRLDDRTNTIALLNENIEALKQQLSQLAAALDLAETKSKADQAQIADLGAKLNLALATKVEELARYRSEFFGRLRQILGDRPDIRVVGDRFVFQSEVLFQPASADLDDAARQQLMPLAAALKEIQGKIPPNLDWLLEVEGHTDRRPIATAQFASNWELSTARAVSVVKFLVDQGIPAERLAAAGFGEFQPLDKAASDDAYRRNRRIELKLTQR